MAFDAIAVRLAVKELKEVLINSRIEKIYQPERDEICLQIRTFRDSMRLVISASASHPRIHITDARKENPKTPPMFCMLMRKHLNGAKIINIEQYGFERIIIITTECHNELGDLIQKKIITEIMGRYSNIILTDSDDKITDCIKHIDLTVSSVRQLLPGLKYTLPPSQDKPALTKITPDITISINPNAMMKKTLFTSIAGISPLCASEIVYRVSGESDIRCSEINSAAPYCKELYRLSQDVINYNQSPCIITERATGKILDFSAIDIKQYGSLCNITYFDTINQAMDAFYTGRDKAERMRQKSTDLIKLLNTLCERAAKKLIILNNTKAEAADKEKYKIYADLITANLYKAEPSATSITVLNFYSEDGSDITIPMDPSKNAASNAQQYYKKYRKLKTAETEVEKQLEENRKTIDYLENVLMSVENAESESDLNAIRDELADEGYMKHRRSSKNKTDKPAKPWHFVSDDGFDIYIGRSSAQNDYLTLKFANSNDYWFHTKNFHGSHTIIKLGTDKNVPERTIRQAAEAAAYYSKARSSSQVAVDYTLIKNVKKPSGAKPGMVIYENYNTVYVTPSEPVKTD